MLRAKCLEVAVFLLVAAVTVSSQAVYNIYDFDPTSEGPWSDIEKTTLTVPKVPNGSVQLDAAISQPEYGGFEGVGVVPGENAWILDYPADREWDGPQDSSFTFWLAHDDDFFYVAVEVADDIISVDSPLLAAWRDDAIEIIVDALNDDYDVNTDSYEGLYDGHCYVNMEGGFSEWDEAAGTNARTRWCSAVDWTYGPDGDIFAVGKETPTGWTLEVKFNKRIFQDPDAGNVLDNGYVMGFNIGIDDDDMHYEGGGGWTMEIQYWWSNRLRPIGYNPSTLFDQWGYTPEELASEMAADPNWLENNFDWGINSAGRLSHGAAGDIIFAAAVSVESWSVY